MTQATIDLLAKFQTGLVGLLGFTGVITTLVVNGGLERRRVREARDHDRRTLTRAFQAELRSFLQTAEVGVERSKGTGALLVPSQNPTLVFDANVERLGLLSDKQVDAVLHAYYCLKEFDRKVLLISVPSSALEDKGHRRVQPQGVERLRRMYESLLAPLKEAIKVLSGPS